VESLRWILLAAGIAFVLVIYLLGRSRRRRNHSMVEELEGGQDADELPEFSAQNLDNVDEGVGAVRIITGAGLDAAEDDITSLNIPADAKPDDARNDDAVANIKIPSDIIVLYILPKSNKSLLGSQINSSAQAMGLSFGEMNIFHFITDDRSVFSLANMLEPGSFNADTIHDLKTSGLTVFMQIKLGDPMDDLTEMLQRSYQLAGLLDARLCNHKREPLTEQDAENYRTQVREFISGENPELSTET